MSTLNEEKKTVLVIEAAKLADFLFTTIDKSPKGITLSHWKNKKFFEEDDVKSTLQIKFADNWVNHLNGDNGLTDEVKGILHKIFFKLDVNDLCYLMVRLSPDSVKENVYSACLKDFIIDYYQIKDEENFKIFIDKVKTKLFYSLVSNSNSKKNHMSPIKLNGLAICNVKIKYGDKFINFNDFILDEKLFKNSEKLSIPVYYKEDKNLSIREFTDPMNDIESFKIGNVLAIAVNVDRNDINGETKCFANISRNGRNRTIYNEVIKLIKDFRFTSPGKYIDATKLNPSLYNDLRETPVELVPIFANNKGKPVISKFILNILF